MFSCFQACAHSGSVLILGNRLILSDPFHWSKTMNTPKLYNWSHIQIHPWLKNMKGLLFYLLDFTVAISEEREQVWLCCYETYLWEYVTGREMGWKVQKLKLFTIHLKVMHAGDQPKGTRIANPQVIGALTLCCWSPRCHGSRLAEARTTFPNVAA